jgi:hypothetical protein
MTPLNGFLAGILLAFDPASSRGLAASYRIDIDGRRFELAVREGRLAAATAVPDVSVTAGAADLVTARFAATAAERKAALKRVTVEGGKGDVDAMRTAFRLTGDPGPFAT